MIHVDIFKPGITNPTPAHILTSQQSYEYLLMRLLGASPITPEIKEEFLRKVGTTVLCDYVEFGNSNNWPLPSDLHIDISGLLSLTRDIVAHASDTRWESHLFKAADDYAQLSLTHLRGDLPKMPIGEGLYGLATAEHHAAIIDEDIQKLLGVYRTDPSIEECVDALRISGILEKLWMLMLLNVRTVLTRSIAAVDNTTIDKLCRAGVMSEASELVHYAANSDLSVTTLGTVEASCWNTSDPEVLMIFSNSVLSGQFLSDDADL